MDFDKKNFLELVESINDEEQSYDHEYFIEKFSKFDSVKSITCLVDIPEGSKDKILILKAIIYICTGVKESQEQDKIQEFKTFIENNRDNISDEEILHTLLFNKLDDCGYNLRLYFSLFDYYNLLSKLLNLNGIFEIVKENIVYSLKLLEEKNKNNKSYNQEYFKLLIYIDLILSGENDELINNLINEFLDNKNKFVKLAMDLKFEVFNKLFDKEKYHFADITFSNLLTDGQNEQYDELIKALSEKLNDIIRSGDINILNKFLTILENNNFDISKLEINYKSRFYRLMHDNMREIFKSYDVKIFKEEINSILLYSHLFSLKGEHEFSLSKDVVRKINLEGDSIELQLNKLAPSFKEMLDSEDYNVLEDFQSNSKLKSPEDVFGESGYNIDFTEVEKKYNAGNTVVLPSGWSNHYISIVIKNGYIAIVNRGEGVDSFTDDYSDRSGISVFRIREDKNTESLLQTLKEANSTLKKEDVVKNIKSLLGNNVANVEMKAQKAGNCTHANFKSSLLAVDVVNKVYELEKKSKISEPLSRKDFPEEVKKYKKLINDFKKEKLEELLSELTITKESDVPNYTVELAKQILHKYITKTENKITQSLQDENKLNFDNIFKWLDVCALLNKALGPNNINDNEFTKKQNFLLKIPKDVLSKLKQDFDSLPSTDKKIILNKISENDERFIKYVSANQEVSLINIVEKYQLEESNSKKDYYIPSGNNNIIGG